MFLDSPSPGAYDLQSDFNKTRPHMFAYSFGISRDAYKKVYIKGNPAKDLSLPGPGVYNVSEKAGKNAKKVSMLGRNSKSPYG